ncbi:siderophore-interacting protein [Streptomyces sp. NBC_01304]|uniref:siderophore-interacting protein n=1 Tax=Streptomyces sp. NBC_01304 TaxID=2903818 RepID=UPI002E0DA0C3|nr:siderophore-interacting protein [Streptomyces sp. NBC_01304]
MTYDDTAPRTSGLPLRLIEVARTRRITPGLARVTFTGPDLADFRLDAPDQQVKLYFPKPGQTVPRLPEPDADGDLMRWYAAYNAIPEDVRPWMRSYTVRAHDPQQATIDIDFVLHGEGPHGEGPHGEGPHGEGPHGDGADTVEGPATRWAQTARPGDRLGMFGPSAYFAKDLPLGTTDWTLLAGDETALPALGTIIEALPEAARAVAFIEVADAAEQLRFETRADLTVHWLHRGGTPPGRSDVLLEAVRAADFPEGSVYAWLAGESGSVRALRRHLVDERGLAKPSIDFAGYWRLRLTQDDAPTEADLADVAELLAQARQQ